MKVVQITIHQQLLTVSGKMGGTATKPAKSRDEEWDEDDRWDEDGGW